MTDLRDTDRRVAKALGYIVAESRETGYRVTEDVGDLGGGPVRSTSDLPPYETDFGPWTHDMLDWLAVHDIELDLWVEDTDPTIWLAGDCGSKTQDLSVHTSKSITGAIANLVIAVSEREEQSRE